MAWDTGVVTTLIVTGGSIVVAFITRRRGNKHDDREGTADHPPVMVGQPVLVDHQQARIDDLKEQLQHERLLRERDERRTDRERDDVEDKLRDTQRDLDRIKMERNAAYDLLRQHNIPVPRL